MIFVFKQITDHKRLQKEKQYEKLEHIQIKYFLSTKGTIKRVITHKMGEELSDAYI